MDLEVGMLVGSAAQIGGLDVKCVSCVEAWTDYMFFMHICGVQFSCIFEDTNNQQQCHGCWCLQRVVFKISY